jgi:ABC-type glycerol-3-phosphate transport system substrate-binding protein
MRKLLAVLALVLTTGIAFAGTASAAPQASAQTTFTCVHFQDPTVELVWSHVCHF